MALAERPVIFSSLEQVETFAFDEIVAMGNTAYDPSSLNEGYARGLAFYDSANEHLAGYSIDPKVEANWSYAIASDINSLNGKPDYHRPTFKAAFLLGLRAAMRDAVEVRGEV